MLYRFLLITFLFTCCGVYSSIAQEEYENADSIFQLQQAHITDSLQKAKQKQIADSLIWRFIAKKPISTSNQFVDSLLRRYVIQDHIKTFLFTKSVIKKNNNREEGTIRKVNKNWLILVLLGLLFANVFVNLLFNKTTRLLLNGFFNDRVFFNQICYEDLVFRSSAFFLQYILSCFSLGLFTYLLINYLSISEIMGLTDGKLFMMLSLLICVLFTLKILVLKICAFIFRGVKKVLRIYIAILYLILINLSWLALALAVIFAFLSINYNSYLVIFASAVILIAIVFQFTRMGAKILSDSTINTLSKVYLIVYFCALEMCPLLLLLSNFRLNK